MNAERVRRRCHLEPTITLNLNRRQIMGSRNRALNGGNVGDCPRCRTRSRAVTPDQFAPFVDGVPNGCLRQKRLFAHDGCGRSATRPLSSFRGPIVEHRNRHSFICRRDTPERQARGLCRLSASGHYGAIANICCTGCYICVARLVRHLSKHARRQRCVSSQLARSTAGACEVVRMV